MVKALGGAGIQVYPDSADACAPQIVAVLTNTVFSGPHENIERHEDIYAAEGDIYCEVDIEPAPAAKGDPRALRTYPAPAGDGTTYEIGNVVCTLRSPERAKQAQGERLAGALRSLPSR